MISRCNISWTKSDVLGTYRDVLINFTFNSKEWFLQIRMIWQNISVLCRRIGISLNSMLALAKSYSCNRLNENMNIELIKCLFKCDFIIRGRSRNRHWSRECFFYPRRPIDGPPAPHFATHRPFYWRWTPGCTRTLRRWADWTHPLFWWLVLC